jgi:hypothetical protein
MSNLSYNGQNIEQRDLDGYVNGTQMCQANGKKVNDWMRGQDAKRYIDAISSVTGIPASQLVVSMKGNSSNFEQGTWVHPKLAIKLARWISVEFELWCDEHIKTLLETGQNNFSGRLNVDWFGRIVFFRKHSQIPVGYFTVFEELTHSLISDFEAAEYQLPDKAGLDISAGRRWSDYAKAHYPNINELRIKCKHHYPDNRGAVDSFAYKDCLLPDFRRWLEYEYKLDHLFVYLKKKDPRAIQILADLLQIQLTPSLFDMKLLN